MSMKRKQFYLEDQQLDKLDAISKRTGISKAELVRRAIDKLPKDLESLGDMDRLVLMPIVPVFSFSTEDFNAKETK